MCHKIDFQQFCMYVVCNHDPGPSVLGTPDPRRTETFRVKSQHPNSQSPHTSKSVKNCVLSHMCLKIKTRLIDEMFPIVMGECVFLK